MKKLLFGLAILFTGVLANGQTLKMYADSVSGANGTQVTVPVRVENFSNIIGAQGTVEWNTSIVTFDTVQSFGLPSMFISNFGLTQTGAGKLTFSWNDPTLQGVTKTNGDIVFEIVFNVVGSAGQSTNIDFVNTPTSMEFTDNSFSVVGHTTTPGQVAIPGGGGGGACNDVRIYADTVVGNNGNQVTVNFKVDNFTSIIGMQGTFTWNTSVATFDTIQAFGLPSLFVSNFGLGGSGTGTVTFSWNDPTLQGVTVSDGTVIWQVVYDLVGTGGANTPISFVNTPTSMEFTDNTFSVVNHCADPGKITSNGGATCTDPASLTSSNLTSSSATLTWISSNPGATYTVEYGPSGFTPGSGTTVTGTSVSGVNNVNITGLSASTTYQFYVQENCGGSSSTNVGPTSFTTTSGGGGGGCTDVSISADTVSGANGSTVTVSFTVDNFTNIIGMQGTFTWNTSIASFDTIQNFGLPSMFVSNFGLGSTGTGTVTFSWNDPTLQGVTVSNGTVIWQVVYTIVGSGGASTAVNFVNSPTSMEFTDNSFSVVNHCTNPGQITATGGASCNNPTSLSSSNVTQTSATVSFSSTNPGATYTVEYGPTGFTPGSGSTQTGTSVSGTNNVNLSGLTAGTTYQFYVQENCGGSSSQQVGPQSFTTQSAGTCNDVTIYADTASGANGTTVTVNFKVNNFSNIIGMQGTFTWNTAVATLDTIQGFGLPSMFISNFGLGSAGTGTVTFSWNDPTLQGVTVNNGTVVWQAVFTIVGSGGASTAINFVNTPTSMEFTDNSFSVVNHCTNPGQVTATGGVTCTDPASLTTSNITSSSATLTWISSNPGATYTVEYGPTGFTPGSGTTVNGTSVSGVNNVNITGLSASTTYQFYVQENCGGTSSQNVGPQAFTTLAASGCTDVTIQADTVTGQNGTTVTMNFSVKNFSLIIGMQGTFNWNTSVATFDTIQSFGLPGLNISNFGLGGAGGGNVTFSWNDATLQGVTVSDGTVIFQVVYTIVGSGGASTAVNFVNSPTQMEFTDNSFSVVSHCTNPGAINVTSSPCPDPTALAVSNIQQTSADVTFNSSNAGATYTVEYGPSGFTPGSGTTINGTSSSGTNTVNITGLTAGNTYDVYVQENCSGPTSNNIGPATWTACQLIAAGYTTTINGLGVAFTDTSTNTPTSWNWDFGDGTFSINQNPVHQYQNAGSYTVCLIATHSCDADTICTSVTVAGCPSPNSAFTFTTSNLTANFTDGSNGTGTLTYGWTFGDGNTSNAQNPSHTYGAPGTYTACLTLNDSCGSQTNCQNVTVSCPAPVAVYTPNTSGLSATFTDGSSGNPTSWSWDFGDGNSSNVQNPSHSYASAGAYNVCMIASSVCGSDTFCQNVNVICPLQNASFTHSTTNLTVNFTDGTAGNITAWQWNFGDGSGSSLQNPTYTYQSAGTYTVCLTVTDSCGSDSSCNNVTVTAPCPLPTAGFSNSISNLQVAFTDQSTNSPTSWSWDFGDANTSNTQNPTHTYANAGTYTVCLISTNACGSDTSCSSVTVSMGCTTPVAAFNNIPVNLQVNFVDQSTNNPTSWSWNFGDANTSNQQNPVHTYASAGTYTVCLIATNACGSDTSCTSITVSVGCNAPVAAFNSVPVNLQVNFVDQTSNNPTSWSWDFGDANTSNQQNPVHTYANPGTYTVCLTATNACGSDSSCTSVTVTQPCPIPGASFSVTTNGLQATFNDQSSNNPTSWSWNFGDANTSNQQNPVHTYANGGVYTVCLIVSNACGSDTTCSSVTATAPCPTPVTNFGASSNGLQATFTDQSTNNPTSWTWDFGDANTSNQQNPNHTYASGGTYTVCVTATNACGSDSSCQTITVSPSCPTPAANFSTSINNLNVTFGDQSTNNPTSWSWDFGDANGSNLQNPSHTYAASGTYTVCLISTNSCGPDTACAPVTVTAPCPPPTAGFGSTPNGLNVAFSDVSSNNPTSWAWDFGDANNSNQQNPSHTYAASGTYTVCLVVANSCGIDTVCNPVSVTDPCPAPTASFTHTTNNLAGTFTDGSTGGVTSWAWNFGDGGTSPLQNPVHSYATAGTYTVCLIASKSCGSSDTTCSQVTVTSGCSTPIAAFTASGAGFTQTFLDNSSNSPTTWLWDFGDGSTSNQQNPSHTYASAGTYLACLTITNACGNDSTCQVLNIICPLPGTIFQPTNISGMLWSFLDQTSNTPTSWTWTFGDGGTSTLQNPSHQYTSTGLYTVCLTAGNICGTKSFCQQINVVCPQPSSAFTEIATNNTVSFTDASTNATGWFWTFGDGGTDTTQNPSHTYSSPGNYTVCLTVTNACGQNSFCKQITVTCPQLVSQFTFTTANLVATFTDASTGALTWFWNFGDGATDTVNNPVHTYTATGTYTVCLTVDNGCTSHTTCQSVTVDCPLPTGGFTFTQSNLNFQFTDQSINSPVSWAWDFGDGTFSGSQNPAKTYLAAGTYTVCLIATNECGDDTTCEPINVVGIDNDLFSEVQIFPNPTSGQLNVDWKLDRAEAVIIRLYSNLGVMVREINVREVRFQNSTSLDLTELASGVYHLELNAGEARVNRKIILE